MKRLLKVACGLFITSIFPILTFLLLGITTGQTELSNIFSIIYPFQFISSILVSIFATGANIKREKEKNENSVPSGLVFGIIIGGIVFTIAVVFIEPYLRFMNVDVAIYREYSIYGVLYLFLQMVLSFMMEKLYFEEKEKTANILTLVFGLLNFIFTIGLSLITKNSVIVIAVTLSVLLCYIIGLLIWQFKKFKLEFNIWSNFKYESANVCADVFVFCAYFFGLSNVFSMGEQYMVATNLITLITDPFWDMSNAVETCAKIDIASDNYNFKKTIKNSAIFHGMIIIFNFVLYFAIYSVYNVDILIGLYFLLFQVADFGINIFYSSFQPYVQIDYSPRLITMFTLSGCAARVVFSTFLPTPFCNDIAQIVSGLIVLPLLMYVILFKVKINKEGTVAIKQKKPNKYLI